MNEIVKLSDAVNRLTENVDTSKGQGDVNFVRFDSKGDGVFHTQDIELDPTEAMIADITTVQHGWMCWSEAQGAAPKKVMVSILQGPRPAEPAQLDGYKPWSKAWGIGIVTIDDTPELFWIENNTWGWELVYQKFILETVIPRFQADGAGTPIVRLTNNGKRDKNGNLYPHIELVKWESPKLLEEGSTAGVEKPEPEKVEEPAGGRRRRRRAAA